MEKLTAQLESLIDLAATGNVQEWQPKYAAFKSDVATYAKANGLTLKAIDATLASYGRKYNATKGR